MKNVFYISRIFAISLIFSLFFSCNHAKNKPTQSPDGGAEPPLILLSMKIHGMPVEDEKVTVGEEEITQNDIVAVFQYGNITTKDIKCTIAGGKFDINAEESPKVLNLSVAKLAGKHGPWSEKIEVFYKEAPALKDRLYLRINGFFDRQIKGIDAKMLPDEFIEDLRDGKKPELEVSGGTAPLEIRYIDIPGSTENKYSEVEFECGGTKETQAFTQPNPSRSVYKATSLARFTDKTLTVKITVKPKDSTRYSPHVYEFSLKTLGIMPVKMGYKGYGEDYHENGRKETLLTEKAKFVIQSFEDCMDTVTISDGTNTYDAKVVKSKTKEDGRVFWDAYKEVPLDKNLSTYTVTVTPKNPRVYENTVYTYQLKYIPENECAEFAYLKDEPEIGYNLTFKEGCQSKYINMYGLTKIGVRAKTLSTKATVHYKMIDPITNGLVENYGSTVREGVLTSDGEGQHEGEISLLEDKPTHLVLYVVAGDGSTQDSEKGSTTVVLNAINLFWDVTEANLSTNDKRNSSASKGYDVVKIDEDKVKANGNKFYLCFTCIDEEYGVRVGESIGSMAGFKKLDKVDVVRAYQVTVDAKDLIDKTKNVIELDLPLLRYKNDSDAPINPAIESFRYKVKIKLAQ